MHQSKVIQSYKKQFHIPKSFDTIIIGSGIGSLAAAAILAKEGQQVLVLERHYEPGGFTHVFKRRGYEWDVGIHYIGEMQRPNSMMKKLFDYITDGTLEWADMGDVYDCVVIGDKKYNFVKGIENFQNQLIEYFPDEQEAIENYVALVFKTGRTARNFFVEKVMPPMLSKLVGGLMRRSFLKYAEQTTYDVLHSLTDNEELIKVLAAQYGDYGLPPKQSSFGMHTTVVGHYFGGGNFPVGGSSRVVDTIVPVLAQSKSHILISAEVDKIIIEKNVAKGVRMKDGKTFMAKNIISGAGIMTTYKKLLPSTVFQQHQLESQLSKINNSISHACLYVGLNASPSKLNLPKANYWIFPEDLDHDSCVERYLEDINQPFPVVYISFPAAKDPDWPNRYPNKSTIDIITVMPYDSVEKWENERWKKRGADYDALKEKIAQRLLDELFRLEPQVKDYVDYYELSTPLTTKHFVNYEKGEIYGLDHSPERFKNKFLRPHTPVKNLYLTGQDIMTAGVGSAMFSGLVTTCAMLKRNILGKVVKGN